MPDNPPTRFKVKATCAHESDGDHITFEITPDGFTGTVAIKAYVDGNQVYDAPTWPAPTMLDFVTIVPHSPDHVIGVLIWGQPEDDTCELTIYCVGEGGGGTGEP